MPTRGDPAGGLEELGPAGPGQADTQHQAEGHRQGQGQQGEPLATGEGAANGNGLRRGPQGRRGHRHPRGGPQGGVVTATTLRITEGEVGLLEPAEGLPGLVLGQGRGVRVVALAQAAKGLPQLLGGRLAGHLQQLVMIGSRQRRTPVGEDPRECDEISPGDASSSRRTMGGLALETQRRAAAALRPTPGRPARLE